MTENQKKKEDQKKVLNPMELAMHSIHMMVLKSALLHSTTENKPIPEKVKEILEKEIPMFQQNEETQEHANFPPNPMFLRLSNILKAQIVEDMFKRAEENQRVKKITRGYVR